MKKTPHVTPWPGPETPTHTALMKAMTDEGLRPYSWSNSPFDVYAAHAHSYNKVICVVEGSITFGLPELERELTLNAGDRLDLPAGTLHNATVSAQGVVCLEAQC
jgi:uncharacterized protein YjlB